MCLWFESHGQPHLRDPWVTAHKQYVVIFLSSVIFFFFFPVDFQVIKVRKHHQSLNTESRQCYVGEEWKTIFG